MFVNFLTNPLETFKSFVFDINWLELSATKHQLVLNDSNIFSNTTASMDLGGSLFITVLLIFFINSISKNWESIFFTIIAVILTQIFFSFLGIQIFVTNEINIDGTWIIGNNGVDFIWDSYENQLKNAHFALFTTILIKEMISFATLFLMWWLFANFAITDTLLIPKTIIEIVDELLYKKNLNHFMDILQIKHHKEVRNFQEFFFKTHGILLFILIANVQGMVPYTSTITSSLLNTFYISLAVFINIIVTLVKEKGFSHLFSLFLPHGTPFNLILLLNPIEFISYSFRIVSLSVRLFANMMAGHTLMKVIAGFSWSLILLGDHYILLHYVPFIVLFLLTFLEIAVGFIQTYIFVTLVYIYLNDIFAAH